MAIDMFDTRSMLKVIFTLFEVRTPFLNTFFTEDKISNSKYCDIDFVSGTQKLAPYVGPQMQGKMIEKKDWETRAVQPPYIKMKDITTAADTLKRAPGEQIYQKAKTPAQKARVELATQILKFMDMITRRREFMAHQALTTLGTITYTGEGISLTVDFNMKATHKVTLGGTNVWSDQTNSNPLKDIKDWSKLIKDDSGLVPDVLFMDTDAAQEFLDHPDISGPNSVLDTRRADFGVIDPKKLPNGLDYIGTLKRPRIDIYEYSENYETDGGVVTPIMTSGTVIMGSTRARCVNHFGAIQDLDANAAVKFFPKSWKEKDPSAQLLLVQSAPLEAPHQIDGFVAASI